MFFPLFFYILCFLSFIWSVQAVRKGLSEQRDSASSQLAFGVFLVRRAQSQPAPSPICPFSFSILCPFPIKAGQWHKTVTHISCKHPPAPSKSQDQHIGKTCPPLFGIPGNSAKANKGRQQAQACVSPFNRTLLSILEWHKQGTPKPGTAATSKIAVMSLNLAPLSLCGDSCTETALSEGGFGCAASVCWYHQLVYFLFFQRPKIKAT